MRFLYSVKKKVGISLYKSTTTCLNVLSKSLFTVVLPFLSVSVTASFEEVSLLATILSN